MKWKQLSKKRWKHEGWTIQKRGDTLYLYNGNGKLAGVFVGKVGKNEHLQEALVIRNLPAFE